jgi:hypothetical protein
MPGWSRNWLRTSTTTCEAARPTARIASEENRNATEPPSSSPASTSGRSMRMPWNANPASFRASSKEPNSDVAAITAVAMAMPFVMAFVEFPMASRPVRIFAGLPSNSPDISAMPCALSEMGPNVSIETMTPTVVSMPMPVSEMKYRRSAVVSPSRNAPTTAPTMMMSDHTVDSSPTEKPARIVVAGPVCVASAISCTGLCFVSVKYCVSTWITLARISPNSTATAGRTSSM